MDLIEVVEPLDGDFSSSYAPLTTAAIAAAHLDPTEDRDVGRTTTVALR